MSQQMSPWNDVLGPFYNEQGLERRGIEITSDLISLPVEEGGLVYPHAQFDVEGDDRLSRREPVIELWNRLIAPAIEDGATTPWTATGLLLQATPRHKSKADIITEDPSRLDEIAQAIANTLERWRH